MTAKTRQAQDDQLIELLAKGETLANASRLVGVSARTVRRRMDNPEFRRHVDEFRADMLTRAAGRLANVLDSAITTLADLLEPNVSPAIRLAAARAALEHCCRIRQSVELEQRLAELENLVATQEPQP